MGIELALKQYGLTKNEIKVYLTLLPLGSINPQEVAKRVDLPRTTVYNSLYYLYQKGLVSKITKGRVTYFRVRDLEKLIDKQRKRLTEEFYPRLWE